MYTQDQIIDLLEVLRNAGYRVGIGQHVQAQRLLLGLSLEGVGPEEIEDRLRRYLTPLVCKSPEEQDQFPGIFEDWAIQHRQAPGKKQISAPSTDVASKTTIDSGKDNSANGVIDKKSFDLPASVYLVFCLLLLIVIYYYQYKPPVSTKNQIGQTPSVIDKTSPPALPGVNSPDPATPPPSASPKPPEPTPLLQPPSVETFDKYKIFKLWIAISLGGTVLFVSLAPLEWLGVRQRYGKRPGALTSVTVAADQDNLAVWLRDKVLELGRDGAAHLGRPLAGQRHRIDLRGTIEATARKAGIFQLRLGLQAERPAYLMLFERTHADDQSAGWYRHWAGEFQRNGLPVDCFFFTGDPRICWRESAGQTLHLEHLASLRPNDRLLIFSDGYGLCDLLAGRLQPWVADGGLSNWRERILLTPVDPLAWGVREQALLDSGFAVVPADASGLAAMVDWLAAGEAEIRVASGVQGEFPSLLRGDNHVFCAPDPPAADRIDILVEQLRDFLGVNGFHWLAASAVFPFVRWELALALGRGLLGDRDAARQVTRLIRLPWFKRGAMPDWLRLRLLLELGADAEREARQAATDLIAKDPRQTGGISLRVGNDVTATRTKKRGLDFGYFITVEFLSGASASQLMLQAPARWRQVFGRPRFARPAAAQSWADALEISRTVDYLALLILFLALAGGFHLHAVSTAGDWDAWLDWKDRRLWVTVMPIVLITFPAAVQNMAWLRLRLPIGATLCALALLFGEWVSRYSNHWGWFYYPINMVFPSLILPSAIVLDVVLLVTGRFWATAIVGGLAWGLLFYPANWPVIAPFHVPVEYVDGVLMSLADLQGYHYVRAGLPEYMRMVERGTLRTFGRDVAPVSAVFASFMCMLVYSLWNFLGRLIFASTKFLFASAKSLPQAFKDARGRQAKWGFFAMLILTAATFFFPLVGLGTWLASGPNNKWKGRLLAIFSVILFLVDFAIGTSRRSLSGF